MSSYAIDDIRNARFDWNFGDGCPVGTGMTVIHYFMEPGVYEVTMTVTTGTDVKTASVTVTVSGTEPLSGFEFLHAPFSSRTAQFITVTIPPSVTVDPQNQLIVRLTKADGSDPVTCHDVLTTLEHGFGSRISKYTDGRLYTWYEGRYAYSN